MFQPRSNEFDSRGSPIGRHLRAIEQEIGGIGKSAGRHASAGAASAGSLISDALAPIVNDIVDRFRRGQRTAIHEGENFGKEAIKIGARASVITAGVFLYTSARAFEASTARELLSEVVAIVSLQEGWLLQGEGSQTAKLSDHPGLPETQSGSGLWRRGRSLRYIDPDQLCRTPDTRCSERT
jgi:hypothetical protein